MPTIQSKSLNLHTKEGFNPLGFEFSCDTNPKIVKNFLCLIQKVDSFCEKTSKGKLVKPQQYSMCSMPSYQLNTEFRK